MAVKSENINSNSLLRLQKHSLMLKLMKQKVVNQNHHKTRFQNN